MPAQESKIYNDAPDEFAKFLDSERFLVTLSELGGINNPFVKENIYKKHHLESDDGNGYTVCPKCGNFLELCFLEYDDTITCYNRQHGPWTFKVTEEDCTFYEVDRYALAKFMSKGLGCSVCRQFKGGWLFGKLRGYDLYFADSPTAGMYRALESTPKSVLIIGQNTPTNLPPALATRVIYLARLLYVQDGTLHFDNEAVEEKIPLLRGRTAKATEQGEKPAKEPSRPPIQVYTPYYLMMMGEWLEKLQREEKHCRPKIPWIAKWLHKNGPSFLRGREPLSDRQIYRHLDALTGKIRAAKGKPDCRSLEFILHWNGCLDSAYVARFSVANLGEAISEAYTTAKKHGFKIESMRDMDAADFADKVKNPNISQETDCDE